MQAGAITARIGGFVDATSVTRSTTTGNGLGTSFGTIPILASAARDLSETRLSAQNTRLSLLVTSQAGRTAMQGFVEVDFGGNAAGNLQVTSNSNTLRMRHGWAQATIGRVDVVLGQSWGLLTPGRNGISPSSSNVFFTQLMDTNFQAGLVWTRAAQFRVTVRPSNRVALALALENPQQYVGSAVRLPNGFPAAQVNTGSNAATPNTLPDVIGKMAVDVPVGGLRQHVEVSGVVRRFRVDDPSASAATTATGTGGSLNANLELRKGIRLIGNTFFSRGGGRYIANTNIPDFIVDSDRRVVLVSSRSLMAGAEVSAGARTLLFGYASEARAERTLSMDPATSDTIGFGVAGQSAANHTVKEWSVGVNHSFFKDPAIGTLQLIAQYSNLTRTPFSVPSGVSTRGRTRMFFFDLRYILP